MNCPNNPAHDRIELAFYDDEQDVCHWHCVSEIAAGGPCHAEWVTEGPDVRPQAETAPVTYEGIPHA